MPYVDSSAIRRVEYSAGTRVLSIWFVESGGPYDFYGVPQYIYDGLLAAPSKGGYFNDHIRDRYNATR